MSDEVNGFLHDSQGNKSSKRLLGVIFMAVGGLFLLITGVFALYKTVSDPTTAIAVGKTMLYAGAGLLGIGVVEKFGGSK